ncbi:unnamed protein product [Lota lota]
MKQRVGSCSNWHPTEPVVSSSHFGDVDKTRASLRPLGHICPLLQSPQTRASLRPLGHICPLLQSPQFT